jgi:hypothetical protein
MTRPDAGTASGPPNDGARLEEIVSGFERAWQAGRRPDLDEYLPAEGPLRRDVLVELIHADLECRLKGGEPARVEEYLRRYPELAGAPDVILDLALREYELRCAREGPLPFDDYARRFPQCRAALRRRWRAFSLEGTGAGEAAPAPGPAEAVSIPGYEVLGELGRGGMGVVYKARQAGLNRTVALKMILAGTHAGPQELARFRAEAEAVARLQHPNIVQVFEVGEAEGHPFFSLEYCPRGTLHANLRGTPLTPRKAAGLVEVLSRAMAAAHGAGIVHRDLKPANVLVAADGRLKITDFGLAKRLDGSAGRTASGAIMGTPSYIAPEQAAGKAKEVGPAADVYALGAILYELLTGRPPFRAATPLDTILQVLHDEPLPPGRLQPETPPDLEIICLKCLEKEPGKRYASARDLADDLHRFLAGEPIRARPVGPAERLRRWGRRHLVTTALLVALACTLLLGAAAGALAVRAAAEARAERQARVAAEAERGRAEAQAEEARQSALAHQQARVAAESERGRAEAQAERAEQALRAMQAAGQAKEAAQARQPAPPKAEGQEQATPRRTALVEEEEVAAPSTALSLGRILLGAGVSNLV